MPYCAAVNCNARREKGVRLFRFPEGVRRTLWIRNMSRGDKWTATASRLCEIYP